MSYLKKIEYEIVPRESFPVIRNCSGCGAKALYRNTKKFRVNANGNKLDVWLIYQCEKCKHTLNLTIYERRAAASIPREEYERFLSNDEKLAEEYGRNHRFFQKNKAEIDYGNTPYQMIKKIETEEPSTCGQQLQVIIRNPYGLKIRPEKQLSEVLGISVSRVKRLIAQEDIILENTSAQFISIYVNNVPTEESLS